jgi:hypothetical protein
MISSAPPAARGDFFGCRDGCEIATVLAVNQGGRDMKGSRICTLVMSMALIGLVGIATSGAQTTNVLDEEDITIKGKLAPDGTAVTGESLSGNTNNVSVLKLEIVAGGVTNHTVVIGQVSGSNVVSLLQATSEVDLTPTATKGDKSAVVFEGSAGSATNAVLFLTITDKFRGTNTTATVKFQGIWNANDAVSGTMATVKVK